MGYYALERKKINKSTKQIGVFLGAGLFLLGILRGYPYGMFAGAAIIISLMFRKIVYIDETGLVTKYSFFKLVHTDTWRFDEIRNIHKELDQRRPEAAALHFTRRSMSKMVLFRKEDCDAIVKMAKSANPSIFYDELPEK